MSLCLSPQRCEAPQAAWTGPDRDAVEPMAGSQAPGVRHIQRRRERPLPDGGDAAPAGSGTALACLLSAAGTISLICGAEEAENAARLHCDLVVPSASCIGNAELHLWSSDFSPRSLTDAKIGQTAIRTRATRALFRHIRGHQKPVLALPRPDPTSDGCASEGTEARRQW